MRTALSVRVWPARDRDPLRDVQPDGATDQRAEAGETP